MPRLVSGKTYVPEVCVNGHLVFSQQEVVFSLCPSVFLLQIQWPMTPPLSTHLALGTPVKTLFPNIVTQRSRTELWHMNGEWGGKHVEQTQQLSSRCPACLLEKQEEHDITYIPGKQCKHCQIPVVRVPSYEPKTIVQDLYILSWYNCQTTLQNRYYYCCPCSWKSLCVCDCMCVCVIMSTQVPWCPCGGHRGALGVSLHLPPCIRQDLFTISHCVYQASRPLSSKDSPVSTSHLP